MAKRQIHISSKKLLILLQPPIHNCLYLSILSIFVYICLFVYLSILSRFVYLSNCLHVYICYYRLTNGRRVDTVKALLSPRGAYLILDLQEGGLIERGAY